MNANPTTSLADVKQHGGVLPMMSDQAVDMFTERGFALANRIAKAYASSDAVPAQFRSHNLKKDGQGSEIWVENTAAMGNCLVAIEVARAVGMSITAVMQNADMIEGKLRWSGRFVIAAINASGRFTPLRFQMVSRGRIKAKYKEKVGWDSQARRPKFEDREVEVDDIECIAWALPKGYPEPKLQPDQLRAFPGRMLDLYRALGLPVIESAPVTMQMVVEEGWYGKPGSKWQTSLRTLMFQYRSGSFFGNIHAPDIVMGMGQTTEEVRDLAPTFDVDADGVITPTPISELRPPAPGPVPMADVVEPPAPAAAAPAASAPAAGPAQPAGEWEPSPAELEQIRQRELAEAAGTDQPAGAPAAPAGRRARATSTSME
ncbi:hypothetical protein [Aquabacterium sp. OR-4]|uniref:hypothetical protein n=1 Tax=Aquabacterium sp. OR-4 TaxID=2978127 RepID=UPI0028C57BBD|nr:hypothetical protein [Aquabacterium sp. OR-4]MDT7835002.1 hypothetical protein [Aquabacterium sp. OR-4]